MKLETLLGRHLHRRWISAVLNFHRVVKKENVTKGKGRRERRVEKSSPLGG